ncbi:aspartyl/glutamyl-tRNA amidotransferase subunit C [Gammaproteobacteria bacterium]|nr:aspartyl/glutamyl-tRNA amidotransferase subunit C [Gammaproteobacteria bacterium]
MSIEVDKTTVLSIAEASQIRINEHEINEYQDNLNSLLVFFDQIENANTETVNHLSIKKTCRIDDLRADQAHPQPADNIHNLKMNCQAVQPDHQTILVPKVIEKSE